MNESILKKLSIWAKMSYEENPFGAPIPLEFLQSPEIIKPPRTKDAPVCLAQLNQDGKSLQYIANDLKKQSSAEKTNYVLFSEIFHQLYEANTLCPSNYVKTIIDNLDDVNKQLGGKITRNEYIGYITRGLRAFASYVRELYLFSVLEEYLSTRSNMYNFSYKLYKQDSTTDIEEKTDIMFSIDGRIYRIWSYQSTPIGIKKTSYRILKGCCQGFNILLPFDRLERLSVSSIKGWDLYNRDATIDILDSLFRQIPHIYEDVKYKIEEEWKNFEKPHERFVANPQIFYVPKAS